ncbi:MAG: LysR family transcriptional regulator [Treponema sp.]|jgi:molybdate transport system regulatory protein|nr:LysR family transcriptional regulator [Treponema sp.]
MALKERTDPGHTSADPEKEIQPTVKVFLVASGMEKSFCGPGMITLLLAIKETGNVRQACENMRMSYSKGWKLLKTLEGYLGFSVAVRYQGGKGGGKAYLTDEGLAFLEKHRSFLQDCQNAVQQVFNAYYGGDCIS